MKRLVLLICIFFFIAIGMAERAYSDSVNMLYTNYSIQQTMNEVYDLFSCPGCPGRYIGTFSDSSGISLSNNNGLPLSAETQSTHGWSSGSSSISLFSVQNNADANWINGFYISVPGGYARPRYPTLAITNVDASWGFRPTGSSLEFNLLFSNNWGPYPGVPGDYGISLSAKLWDTTDSTTLISLDPSQFLFRQWINYSNDYTFLVNPNHIYEFDVSGTSGHGIYDTEYLRQSVTASGFSITPVPESSTILLLGTGFLGLVGLRRKFKK